MNATLKSIAPFLFFILLANLCACQSHNISLNDPILSRADSLIQTQRINENTLLLSFGAESISAIHTDMGIVVIDAGISTGLTHLFRKHIEHESRLKDCVPHSEEWHENFRQYTRYQQASSDAKELIPIRKPNITFLEDYVIDMGNATFDLKYFGQCHSNSDILIHVPELELLFTGDLMFEYGRPSIRDSTMAEQVIWRGSLAWIEERMDQIETVIGGHGHLLSSDDLKAFVGIMNNMLAQNSHGIAP